MVFENFITFINKILCFSSFINSASGFPKPLSLEEERKHFKKFKEGDLDSKNILITHNLGLVAHIVKKYSGAGEADDLISIGSIGLIKAINSFELSKGTQLSTYAARCIENEILMYIRLNKKHRQAISLQECLGEDKDGNEIELEDVIPDLEDEVIEIVEKNILTEKMTKLIKKILPKREYDIIRLRYGLKGQDSPNPTRSSGNFRDFALLYFKVRKQGFGYNQKRSRSKKIIRLTNLSRYYIEYI